MFLMPAAACLAEDGGQADYETFFENIRKPYFSPGILCMVWADFERERAAPGSNGFSIGAFRFKLSGEFDRKIGYFFQTEFAQSPAIIDAKVYFRFRDSFQLGAGLFKTPFSKEFLIIIGETDFIRRAQVADKISPKRQIGMMAEGWLFDSSIYYGLGLFNGNNFGGNENDDDNFMYAGRLAYLPDLTKWGKKNTNVEIGLNAGFSDDSDVNIGGGLFPNFHGERRLAGGDIRLTSGDLLLAGEIIYLELRRAGERTRKPAGFYFTTGYSFAGNSQLLLRWDALDTDTGVEDSEMMVIGYNLAVKPVGRLQVNYMIPWGSGRAEHHRVLVNMQVQL